MGIKVPWFDLHISTSLLPDHYLKNYGR